MIGGLLHPRVPRISENTNQKSNKNQDKAVEKT